MDTGCRPQELRYAEARQIDFDTGLIHFADGEIRGKQFGRDVIVPERAAAILNRRLAHPEGPVFRNEDGNPWTKDALNCRFQRLRKMKLPLPGQLLRRPPRQSHRSVGKWGLGRGRGLDPGAPRPDRGAEVLRQAHRPAHRPPAGPGGSDQPVAQARTHEKQEEERKEGQAGAPARGQKPSRTQGDREGAAIQAGTKIDEAEAGRRPIEPGGRKTYGVKRGGGIIACKR